MGPVLFFRGQDPSGWRLSALMASPEGEKPEPLVIGAERVFPRLLATRRGRSLWRYDFSLPGEDVACARRYAIGDRSWTVHVPGPDGRLRTAFTACNGSERGEETWSDPDTRNARWLHLAGVHALEPFHVLLQGGDQLYAD